MLQEDLLRYKAKLRAQRAGAPTGPPLLRCVEPLPWQRCFWRSHRAHWIRVDAFWLVEECKDCRHTIDVKFEKADPLAQALEEAFGVQ